MHVNTDDENKRKDMELWEDLIHLHNPSVGWAGESVRWPGAKHPVALQDVELGPPDIRLHPTCICSSIPPATVRPWRRRLQRKCRVGSVRRCCYCCCFREKYARDRAPRDCAPLCPSGPCSGGVSSWRSWRRWRAPGPAAGKWWPASLWRGGDSLWRWLPRCGAAGQWRPVAAFWAPGCALVLGLPPCVYMLEWGDRT